MEESLNTPVAVKRNAPPIGSVTLVGEINTELMVALLTTNGADPLTVARVAEMLALPGTRPDATAPDMLTTEVSEEAQVT